MNGFFRSCAKELTPIGEFHLILHTNKGGINQFDIWGIRELAENNNCIWRAAVPFNWRGMPPYHPKDVTSQNWTPFEPIIYIFTPKGSVWKPEKRAWRPKKEEEMKLMKNVTECPPVNPKTLTGTFTHYFNRSQSEKDAEKAKAL